ncbi:bifunctional metallophosphatase/5'-nucleotidase [Weissella hellenica]|uniref:2',3'-cyclic-nucleotide 2'-phosphodiesterase / 3'-nucleotidase n=1 Tax=Weissella hellenica TaxID=46256 RepID=A0A4Y4G4P5_WEIHE|nr:bifunctional UDP-sugar hydrolase/5'-nucleotidase [Weissella hellenica]NKY67434.1 bifunctional metallophosphatase/5'-nucleotidase [Weissella hellenica]GED36446.1 5'-nucleotidase [Weissella hellenica]SCC07729.1 2',3'-cyclic-nucleotide 2'-phosphodiesterase / 3'-nucleotidase [Weissella hellenica]
MQVSILSTSDVHGYIRADDFRRPLLNNQLGLTRAASVIAEQQSQVAATDDVVVTIENGDFIQGSPLTNYIQKIVPNQTNIYQELADKISYDVRILGNHEFNFGREYIETVFADTDNLLNANILDDQTQKPFVGQPYKIITRKGIKIGIIGLTTQFIPHWEQPAHITNLIFQDPVVTAEQYIAKLRPQVDVLIIAYHGGFAQDLQTGAPLEKLTSENQGYQLLQLPGVDALVTGHQHREIAEVVNGVPTTQPGYRGNYVGLMTLTLNEEHQRVGATVEILPTGESAEREDIVSLIDPLQNRVNDWLDMPVGHVGNNMTITDHFAARLHNHPFIELVNRVQMGATNTQISNTALFNNEVRGLTDAVTQRDIMTNYIFPNTLVVEALTGQDIKDALEVNARYFKLDDQGEIILNPLFTMPKVQHYNYDIWSGIDYTFDLNKPMGQRVTSVIKDGQPLDLNRTYEVTMNNYRAGGAGNFPMFSMDKAVREVQRETADLIGEYIMNHPKVHIPQPTNITIIK